MQANDKTIIKCENLTKIFGGLIAVNNLSFEVKENVIFGIIGPNGAGKSTVFNLISGFLQPTRGRVCLDGDNINKLRPDQRYHLGLAMTFQLPEYFPEMAVEDNVIIGALSKKGKRVKEAKQEAHNILKFIGLENKLKEKAKHLTVAELKRLEVAKILIGKPKCILLDEVMAGFNSKEIDDFLQLLIQINKSNVTLILIEHVMKAIMSISQMIMVLNQGTKVAMGKPEDIVKNEEVIECYLGR